MDPLSTAASVIAVLQLSTKVVKYINSAKGATQQRKSLRERLRACEGILQQLNDEADDSEEGQAWSDTIKVLEAPGAPLGRLWVALREVEERLKPREGMRKAMNILKWPFNEKEVKEIYETIEHEKSLLELALANNSRQLLQEIKRTSGESKKQLMKLVQDIQTTSSQNEAQLSELKRGLDRLQLRYDEQKRLDERQAILRWLTPDDYSAEQSNFLSRRQPGTGQWLLNSPEFKNWLESEKEILLCPGIPGAGKTILTSIVIDELLNRFRNDKDVGVTYLYGNFQRQNEQTPGRLLNSLLGQLAQRCLPLPGHLEALYAKHDYGGSQATYEEARTALHSTVRLYSKVFVVIDALDEFQAAGGHRNKLLSEILMFQAECEVNLFVTSRHVPDILDAFGKSKRLEISANKDDVRNFLDGNISQLPSFVHRRSELEEEVKSAIVNAVGGMFLLAKFHLESLCGKRSVKAVRIALENLPTGSRAYDCAYGDAMKRIESQVRDQEELAKQVISWITRATRRLKATELQYALAVEVGEAIFDEDNLPQLDDMVSSCAGLVTVDKESNVIRLVHYTAQEYFTRTWKQWFPHTEAEITAICCTYLSLETFRCGPCKTNKEYEQRLEENPVFEYAAQNWGLHASNTEAPCQEIIRFLQSTANVEATTQALFVPRDEKGWNPNYYTRFPARFRGLHLAAYFGLAHEAMLLLKNEISNMQDANDRPSRCSASNSQKRFLRPPFETDSIDADSSDSDGLTPLAWAARNGCADVVKLLLESGKTNPDSKDKYGRTPLAWAAAKNHLTVAELLLAKKGVDANSKTCYPHGDLSLGIAHGRTPLSWAAQAGHDTIVRLLLKTSLVDIDPKDELGMTPLSYAAEGGHGNIVELLLTTGEVDADSKATAQIVRGRTPLSFAAEKGFTSIVQQLLQTGKVDPDSKTSGPHIPSRAPLSRGGLFLNLDTGSFEVNSKSTGNYVHVPDLTGVFMAALGSGRVASSKTVGRTPLSWAAEAGKEAVVQLLLDKKANANSVDMHGWTPLLWAASMGHVVVVELLLTAPGVKADQEASGCHEVVNSYELSSPSLFDKGRNSLSLAAEGGYSALVVSLLSKGLSVNSRDQRGRTPLSWAAMNGHKDVVWELLRAGAEAGLADKDGRTPLSYATEGGHETMAELLLGEGAELESRDT